MDKEQNDPINASEAEIRRVVKELREDGIHTLAELNKRYDRRSGAKDIKGIGPRYAAVVRALRRLTPERFSEVTGMEIGDVPPVPVPPEAEGQAATGGGEGHLGS